LPEERKSTRLSKQKPEPDGEKAPDTVGALHFGGEFFCCG
jgi:hypothetical protein